jgi:deoxyribodipyrimidine photolyase
VDDTLLVGTKEEVKWYKSGIKKRFEYKDLRKLCKHLGKENYSLIFLEATMPKMVNNIIKMMEKHKGKSLEHRVSVLTSGQEMQSSQSCKEKSCILHASCLLKALMEQEKWQDSLGTQDPIIGTS